MKAKIMILVCCLALCLIGCEKQNSHSDEIIQNPNITEKMTPSPDTKPIDIEDDTYITEDFIAISKLGDSYLVMNEEKGLCTLSLTSDIIVENGSILHVAYDGNMLETYPMQFGKIKNIDIDGEVPIRNTLLEQYINLISKIYEEDKGLNGDSIVMDFTDVENLTKAEKEALLYIIEQKYDIPCEEGTMESLKEAGRIDENNNLLDCVLFSFYFNNIEENSFDVDIGKYRSPLGAYGYNAHFEIKDNRWVYEVGNAWIS